jgi:hypothetical protein
VSADEHTRWREEIAAYLLGSLEDNEAAELERHLETCEACRTELGWLRPAIEVLSDSAPRLQPPPELRRRLLAEVRAEAGEDPERSRPPFSERMRSLVLRPATALAASAVVAAGVAGYVVAGDDGGGETTVFMEQQGAVSARLSEGGDSGRLLLSGVKRPAGRQVYQAWIQRGTTVSASSQLRMGPDGRASARIDGLEGADNVMVTLEDRPGRRQPTTSPLVTLELAS